MQELEVMRGNEAVRNCWEKTAGVCSQPITVIFLTI